MREFLFLIEDDRYNVPTVEFVVVRDVVRARELATRKLSSSAHHVSVEVSEDGRTLFRLGRLAAKSPAMETEFQAIKPSRSARSAQP